MQQNVLCATTFPVEPAIVRNTDLPAAPPLPGAQGSELTIDAMAGLLDKKLAPIKDSIHTINSDLSSLKLEIWGWTFEC